MATLEQLYKLVEETEFSDRVKNRVKELTIKAKLKKEAGSSDSDCLTVGERNELVRLIKADMVLDGLRAQACRAYLDDVGRILDGLIIEQS